MTKNLAFKDVNQGTALGTLPLTPLVSRSRFASRGRTWN